MGGPPPWEVKATPTQEVEAESGPTLIWFLMIWFAQLMETIDLSCLVFFARWIERYASVHGGGKE